MKKISNRVALALKSLRETRGWSLDKTAEATGVSKAMLGQIEREESSPTVATLWKMARGFDVSFSVESLSNHTVSRIILEKLIDFYELQLIVFSRFRYPESILLFIE